VANLNPATSTVIQAWDQSGVHDWDLRSGLLDACRDEQATRRMTAAPCEPAEFVGEPCGAC
jgi:hypothetical protein